MRPRQTSSIVGAPAPPNSGRGVVAAEQRGRQVDHVAIDQTGVVEVVRDVGAALDQHLEHAAVAQLVEHVAEVTVDLDAPAGSWRRRRRVPSTTRSGSTPSASPAGRRTVSAGIVGPDRARADEHGVAVGPQPVGVERGPRHR